MPAKEIIRLRLPALENNPYARLWLQRVAGQLNQMDNPQKIFQPPAKNRSGFFKLIAEGLKDVGSNPPLWNLASGSAVLKLYRLFYRVLEGPDLSRLHPGDSLTVAGQEADNGCEPASEAEIFPWITGDRGEVTADTFCLLFAGRIYRSLLEDFLEGLAEIFPNFRFILPGRFPELEERFRVESLVDKAKNFTPEYLWAWGYTPGFGARVIEWLGRTTTVVPAAEPWFELLPEGQHELFYPPRKPWMGLPVAERLKNRPEEREKLLELGGRHRKNQFAPEDIFRKKILPHLQ